MKRRTLLIMFILLSLTTVAQAMIGGSSPNSQSLWVILISFLAFSAKFMLATFVYKSNSTAKTNKIFGFVIFMQAFWDLGKTLMWLTTDPATAMFWARISYSAYIISIPVFPHFCWVYLKRKNFFTKHKYGMKVWYLPSVLFIGSLWLSQTLITDLLTPIQSTFGFGIQLWQYNYGPLYDYVFIWFQMLPFMYGFGLFMRKFFATKLRDMQLQLMFLIAGLGIPILIGIPTGVILPAMGIYLPPHNNILTIFMALLIGIGVLKYKFLTIKPLAEVMNPRAKSKIDVLKEYPVSMARQYMLVDKHAIHNSYDLVREHLYKKHFGLIFSTKNPDHVREKYMFQTTPMIWLTDTETDHPAVGPNDVSQLVKTIGRFTSQVKNSFIMIDGLNYLLEHNNFKKILQFVKEIRGIIEQNNCCLIIPRPESHLSNKQENLLRREFAILPQKFAKGRASRSQIAPLQKLKKSKRHVLLGYNYIIESVMYELIARGVKCEIVNPEQPIGLKHKLVKFIKESPLDRAVLERLKLNNESTVVIAALENDSNTILSINMIRDMAQKPRIIANVQNDDFITVAENAGANFVVPTMSLGGRLMSLSLKRPDIVTWLMDATTFMSQNVELTELDAEKGMGLVGKTLGQIDDALESYANVIAVRTSDGLDEIPIESHMLVAGESIVLVADLGRLKHPKDMDSKLLSIIKKNIKRRKV